MKIKWLLLVALFAACASSQLAPLNPLNKAPDQQFFAHFNQWIQTKKEPYPSEEYKTEEELGEHMEFTEGGLMMKNGKANMDQFEAAITTALVKKKFKMPWIYIEFKGHLSKRNTVHIIDYLNKSGIRYRFR